MTELSNITKKGRLIPEDEWKKYVADLKKIKIKTDEKILEKKLIKAVEKRIKKNKKIGVLFSGGVDSTFIIFALKKLGINPVCYSVGVKSGHTRESPDLIAARKIAKEFDLEHKEIILDLKETHRIIKKVVPLVGTNVVKVGVGVVGYAVLEKAKKDKINYLFAGFGSEEIFAGYQRHIEAKNINKECWSGLEKMYDRDLIRDCAIADHFKSNILVPFLDKDVIVHAMQIPGSKKISKTNNKLPIRRIAMKLGIPKEYAYRKKVAAQYGSNIDKAMKKLAKKNGFKLRKDYLDSL